MKQQNLDYPSPDQPSFSVNRQGLHLRIKTITASKSRRHSSQKSTRYGQAKIINRIFKLTITVLVQ